MISRSTIHFLLVLAIIIPFEAFSLKKQNDEDNYRLKTVVIDAGHGGHDPGTSGAHHREKDIALKIALKVGSYIESYFPNVRVIYTRKTDVFVELHERAAIANRAKADLFISVHCNAVPGSKATHGTETYVMGHHKLDANLNVAKRENQVIKLEDDYQEHYDGFDPNSPEAHIIFSLYQDAFQEQSVNFASHIQWEFANRARRHNRGVKQAGFLVLYKTTMPSVLIETGFLTNSTEEAYLNSDKGQEYIASAIYRAFKAYKSEMERPLGPDETVNMIASTEPISLGDKEDEADTKVPIDVEEVAIPVKPKSKTEIATEIGLKYYVQIGVSSKKADPKSTSYKSVPGLWSDAYKNNLYRHLAGGYHSLADVETLQQKLRNRFKDCFVVAYQDGKRLSLKEALALTKE